MAEVAAVFDLIPVPRAAAAILAPGACPAAPRQVADRQIASDAAGVVAAAFAG